MTTSLDPDQIKQELRQVKDPETGVNIVDMGLVYQIKVKNDQLLQIKMTLTSPYCPLADQIEQDVIDTLKTNLRIKQVEVQLVFDPVWTPDKMSAAAKASLGF